MRSKKLKLKTRYDVELVYAVASNGYLRLSTRHANTAVTQIFKAIDRNGDGKIDAVRPPGLVSSLRLTPSTRCI